ncbi:MAG: hypothetical protein CFE39_12515 [Comamonadaceae bacterium PBBC2]|nr:MAG: hypothetical protein CFE39_12515 [Comamonadaceae bacterium PBBC2]
MASIAAHLVNWLLPLRGSKKRMSSEEGMAQHYARNIPKPAPVPARLAQEFHIHEDALGALHLHTVAPRQSVSALRLVYFHGGAYVNEMVGAHWNIVAGLVRRTGATVDIPHYPLAPRHTWADAFPLLQDLALDRLATSPNLAFVGDSAGAGLALALAQVLHSEGHALPNRLVLMSPFLDVNVSDPQQWGLAQRDRMLAAPGLRWAGRQWAGALSTQDPRISPIYGSLAGLPPLMVLTGTADLLNTDAHRLRKAAAAAQHPLRFLEYPDMFHVWMGAPIPEAHAALDAVAEFLRG